MIDDLERTSAVEEWLNAIIDAGNGWAHLRPVGADEAAMLVHQSFKVKLAEQAPQLPQATLVVSKTTKRGKRKPIEIAVSHMRGQPSASELKLPETWRVREDDPGRGLLIEVPADRPQAREAEVEGHRAGARHGASVERDARGATVGQDLMYPRHVRVRGVATHRHVQDHDRPLARVGQREGCTASRVWLGVAQLDLVRRRWVGRGMRCLGLLLVGCSRATRAPRRRA